MKPEIYIGELEYLIKEVKYELHERGDSFTIKSSFDLLGREFTGSVILILIGLFILIAGIQTGKDLMDALIIALFSLFALGLGTFRILIQKYDFMTVSPHQISVCYGLRKKVIPLHAAQKVKMKTKTRVERSKGVSQTYQDLHLILKDDNESNEIISFTVGHDKADVVEELGKGLRTLIKSRIKKLE